MKFEKELITVWILACYLSVQNLFRRVAGSNPGRGDRFLGATEIHSTSPFGWDVKLEV
jgi:hypothetical protein